MSQATATLARIQELQNDIATLRAQALRELLAERDELAKKVSAINAQIAELTGKSAGNEQKNDTGRNIPLSKLKEMLAAAPDKTISIRKEGLQLANIKTLARVNPGLLSIGGKGACPTVRMLR